MGTTFLLFMTSLLVRDVITTATNKDNVNSVLEKPRLECQSSGLRLHLRPQGSFDGHVYVRGLFTDKRCHLDYLSRPMSTPFYVDVPYLGDCAVQKQRMANPEGVMFSVVIVVQKHRLFITAGDRAFRLNCFYRQSETRLEHTLDVKDLPSASLDAPPVSPPSCRYDVLSSSMNGPKIRAATVGQPIVHRWSCDAKRSGFLVHTCTVRDPSGSEYRLVDERGCVTDSSLMSPLKYSDDLSMVFTTIPAFRFADQLLVLFSCQITLCDKSDDGCEGIAPPQCEQLSLDLPIKTEYKGHNDSIAPASSSPSPSTSSATSSSTLVTLSTPSPSTSTTQHISTSTSAASQEDVPPEEESMTRVTNGMGVEIVGGGGNPMSAEEREQWRQKILDNWTDEGKETEANSSDPFGDEDTSYSTATPNIQKQEEEGEEEESTYATPPQRAWSISSPSTVLPSTSTAAATSTTSSPPSSTSTTTPPPPPPPTTTMPSTTTTARTTSSVPSTYATAPPLRPSPSTPLSSLDSSPSTRLPSRLSSTPVPLVFTRKMAGPLRGMPPPAPSSYLSSPDSPYSSVPAFSTDRIASRMKIQDSNQSTMAYGDMKQTPSPRDAAVESPPPAVQIVEGGARARGHRGPPLARSIDSSPMSIEKPPPFAPFASDRFLSRTSPSPLPSDHPHRNSPWQSSPWDSFPSPREATVFRAEAKREKRETTRRNVTLDVHSEEMLVLTDEEAALQRVEEEGKKRTRGRDNMTTAENEDKASSQKPESFHRFRDTQNASVVQASPVSSSPGCSSSLVVPLVALAIVATLLQLLSCGLVVWQRRRHSLHIDHIMAMHYK